MKITKKLLIQHNIYNSYMLAKIAKNKLFIIYIPSVGGIGWAAKWQVYGLDFKTDTKSYWADFGKKTFDVFTRIDKEPQLQKAIAWVKEVYNIDITEKDPYGSWHPKGTLDKLTIIVKELQK